MLSPSTSNCVTIRFKFLKFTWPSRWCSISGETLWPVDVAAAAWSIFTFDLILRWYIVRSARSPSTKVLPSGLRMFTLVPVKTAFMPASVADPIENRLVPNSGTCKTGEITRSRSFSVITLTLPCPCTGKDVPPIPVTIQEPSSIGW